jgi:hypothetical protein
MRARQDLARLHAEMARLRHMLGSRRKALQVIEGRMGQFATGQEIPAELVAGKHKTEEQIVELERKLDEVTRQAKAASGDAVQPLRRQQTKGVSPFLPEQSVRKQLAAKERSLQLIRERKEQYASETNVPLELIKMEQELEARIADLREHLAG